MSDERLERGRQIFQETHGGALTVPENLDPDSFAAHVMRTVYNDVWGRTKMSRRECRLVVLGALAAQTLEFPLETHLRCALEAGDLSAEDLEEIKYLLGVYVGMPRTTAFFQIAERVMSKIG